MLWCARDNHLEEINLLNMVIFSDVCSHYHQDSKIAGGREPRSSGFFKSLSEVDRSMAGTSMIREFRSCWFHSSDA